MNEQRQSDLRYMIWSNTDLNLDDWRDDLLEENPNLTENELWDRMVEVNADYLDDERQNLNIQLNQPIIVIGDIGRWDGRRLGYKMIPSGNIKDCLYSDTEYTAWFLDKRGDLCAEAIHHDGTNHYTYRVFWDGVTQSQIEGLQWKIASGKATRADITRVTKRLGDKIAAVYGWDIPCLRKAAPEPEL